MTRTVSANDVVRSAGFVVGVIAPAIGRDWSVPAGDLDWSVDATVTHMAAVPAKYALCLASGTNRFLAIRLESYPDATQQERLDAIAGVARSLAGVIATVRRGARAYHVTGMADAEGFAALACLEVLVHCYDVAKGLDLPCEPPDDVCTAVAARLMPWLPAGAGWSDMLAHTGRNVVQDEAYRDMWSVVTVPLSEWDGVIPRRSARPAVAWARDDPSGRFIPQYKQL